MRSQCSVKEFILITNKKVETCLVACLKLRMEVGSEFIDRLCSELEEVGVGSGPLRDVEGRVTRRVPETHVYIWVKEEEREGLPRLPVLRPHVQRRLTCAKHRP